MKKKQITEKQIQTQIHSHFCENIGPFTRHLHTAIQAMEERIKTLEAIILKQVANNKSMRRTK